MSNSESSTPHGGGARWGGRALALVGIVLLAFSLRSAVASLSPIVEYIDRDFTLSPLALGLIGTAPPVCFSLFGIITPWLERRVGLERLTLIATAFVAVGLLTRGFAVNSVTLLLATAVVFAGVGSGNILLPPLVKKYFPDRLGLMMTVYSVMMALSTFIPPLLAVPVTEATSWRVSLALWAAFAVAGLLPWAGLVMRERALARIAPGQQSALVPDAPTPTELAAVTGPIAVAPADTRTFGRLFRMPLAWALAAVFGTSSSMAYVAFAWLPSVLVDDAGVSAAQAGFLLSVFAAVAMPCSFVVPGLVVRYPRAPLVLFLTAVSAGAVGLMGFIVAPASGYWAWSILYGLTAILFPLSLVLLSVRARTHESAVALSGFVQSIGYAVAAVFPLLFGLLHATTGAWTVPLSVMIGLLVVSIPAGIRASRNETIEAAWARRHGQW